MKNTRRSLERTRRSRGFTLIELMIVVGILAIIAAIAIPSYTGYITTSRQSAAAANAQPLRLAEEDYWLDNGTYVAGSWIPDGAKTLETGALGWRPDGDDGDFDYQVTISGTNSATITVTHRDDAGVVATLNLSK